MHTQFALPVPRTTWPVVRIRSKTTTLWTSGHQPCLPSAEKELFAKILSLRYLKNVFSTRNLPPCRFPSLDLAAKSNLCRQECSSSREGVEAGEPLFRQEAGTQVGHDCMMSGLQGSPVICTYQIKDSSDLRDQDSNGRKHTFINNQLINLLLRGCPNVLTVNVYFLSVVISTLNPLAPPSFTDAHMHAKSLQSCPTLCDPTDHSPPG